MLYFKKLIFNHAPVTREWRRMLKKSSVFILLLAGVACAGTRALAQAEVDTVYDLRSDGTIRQFQCSGATCGGPTLLDSNPAISSITSGGGRLFEKHNNGAIWQYNGTPCTFTGCPGWIELDNNSGTETIASGKIPGGNWNLFQLHSSGSLWQYTNTPCDSNGVCPGWIELDNNSIKQIIAAGGTNATSSTPAIPGLVQLHSDGNIWQYTGTPCNATSCPGWQHLDNNPATDQIAGISSTDPSSIVQHHSTDGSLWLYTGQPCSGSSCPGWTYIGGAPSAKIIIVSETQGRVFVMNTDGSVWELVTFYPNVNWVERSNSTLNISIAASDNGLFRLQSDGSIYYLGTNGWVLVGEVNTAVTAIAATSTPMP